MRYFNIFIAFLILLSTISISSANIGGVGILWVLISLLIILFLSNFLTPASTNSYVFFNNKKAILLFRDLYLGFGIIGLVLGLVFILGGMAMPSPTEYSNSPKLISNIAIALITLLYGLLFKYFFVLPWANTIQEK